MSLSIAQKLILSFLGLTLLILLATLGLARWSFERGFQDYVNALEQSRLEQVADALAERYVDAGNSWKEINKHSLTRTLYRGLPKPRRRPPPDDDLYEFEYMLPPPEHKPPPPPGLIERPSMVLLAVDGQLIVGAELKSEDGGIISVPIIVGDKKVGELQSLPRRRFDSPQETAFSRQQLVASVFIGIISLAFAVLVSFVLAKLLLAPLRRMMTGVKQLSKGDYSVSLSHDSNDELGKLIEDINHLSKTLKENLLSRQRWLADISHELRTPLTILTGEIQTMKDGIRPFNMEQLLSLEQEVQRLQHLTDDLYQLSLSDIGGLRYEFKTVSLNDCLERVVQAFKQKTEQQGIELISSYQANIFVDADWHRIDQLLTNLFNNSLAYTDSPGKIMISLSANDEYAVIDIEDTPPGISVGASDKLFEPLYRQDASRNRRTAGAGLGLAICRNIVEAHRGIIKASASTKLGGLRIHIQLPRVNYE